MALTSEQITKARIVYDILINEGYTPYSACGVLGNLHVENAGTWSATIDEYSGGGGFGIAQWTPKKNLYLQASQLGLTTSEAETLEGQAYIITKGHVVGQWINTQTLNYQNVRATPYITYSDFKALTDVTQATADFMVHYLRPSTNPQYTHWASRLNFAQDYFDVFENEIPVPEPEPEEPEPALPEGSDLSRSGQAFFVYSNSTEDTYKNEYINLNKQLDNTYLVSLNDNFNELIEGGEIILPSQANNVDVTDLENTLDTAESINRNLYTAISLNILDLAIVKAKQVLNSANTQTEIDRTNTILNTALNSLIEKQPESLKLDELAKAIEQAQSISKNLYTPSSVFNLETSLQNAIDIFNNPNSKQSDIDISLELLNGAITALVLIDETAPDFALLQKAILNSENIDRAIYTSESLDRLDSARTNAISVMNRAGVSQSQIKIATNILNNAFNNLVLKDKTLPDRQCPTLKHLPITSEYGYRTLNGTRSFHGAIDIGSGGKTDNTVFATSAGVVVDVYLDYYGAKCVSIKHDNDKYYSRYVHLDSYSVKIGDKVKAGQQIGVMGNTGYSFGIHLHFVISTTARGMTEALTINPRVYLGI